MLRCWTLHLWFSFTKFNFSVNEESALFTLFLQYAVYLKLYRSEWISGFRFLYFCCCSLFFTVLPQHVGFVSSTANLNMTGFYNDRGCGNSDL